MSFRRTLVWEVLLALALLLAAPPALYRLWQSGDPYLFTHQFWLDVIARFHGTGRMRFIVQPVTAVLLGVTAGIRDARLGAPPFLPALLLRQGTAARRQAWASAMATTRNLVTLAILLDLVSQYILFPEVHPAASLILGPVLIAVPYGAARSITRNLTPHPSTQKGSRAAA